MCDDFVLRISGRLYISGCGIVRIRRGDACRSVELRLTCEVSVLIGRRECVSCKVSPRIGELARVPVEVKVVRRGRPLDLCRGVVPPFLLVQATPWIVA